MFNIGSNREVTFNNLLSIDPDRSSNVLEIAKRNSDEFSGKIIPFGRDPGGNLICFDYRSNEIDPTIIYYDHELEPNDSGNFVKIADSFTDLIDSLYSEDVDF